MKTLVIVTNRLEYKTLYSDLCYPDFISDKRQFKRLVIIDPDHVNYILRWEYGASKIANKYVVNIKDMLWYQHDDQTWLLEKVRIWNTN